jgi:hypothetical protein
MRGFFMPAIADDKDRNKNRKSPQKRTRKGLTE